MSKGFDLKLCTFRDIIENKWNSINNIEIELLKSIFSFSKKQFGFDYNREYNFNTFATEILYIR